MLSELFWTFARVGLFTFGGGYAMIALLENEFVSRRKWIEKDEFLDMVAISESTPGPIAINAATYIGYRIYGFIGALVATVGVCIPSFVIIYAISLCFDAFLALAPVAYAFRGIQVAVVYLIFSAGIKMLKKIKKSAFNVAVISTVTTVMIAFSIFAVSFSTIFYILICGVLGIFVYLAKEITAKKEAEK